VVRRRPRSLRLAFSLCTGDRLADYLAERTGVRASETSVYRLLRAGGIHLKRPQHTLTSPDPEYAVRKRRWSAPAAR
jgi:transposase